MRLRYVTGSSALFMSFLVLSLPIVFAEELNLIYDKNGNLVTGDGLYRVYNGFNQLWKIYNGSDSSGMLLQELIHDPEEERILVKKLFNESGHNYETVYYPAKNYVRVVNNSGTYDYLYVYHEGQLIAVRNPDGSKHFYHPDHLGSTTLITDGSGDEVGTTEYSPFGVILSGGDGSRYDHEGKEFDKITGAFDFHFRNYCAKWGKFCQPDTLIPNLFNPQSLNRYAFELNNPYKYTDPDGHQTAADYVETFNRYFAFFVIRQENQIVEENKKYEALYAQYREADPYVPADPYVRTLSRAGRDQTVITQQRRIGIITLQNNLADDADESKYTQSSGTTLIASPLGTNAFCDVNNPSQDCLTGSYDRKENSVGDLPDAMELLSQPNGKNTKSISSGGRGGGGRGNVVQLSNGKWVRKGSSGDDGTRAGGKSSSGGGRKGGGSSGGTCKATGSASCNGN